MAVSGRATGATVGTVGGAAAGSMLGPVGTIGGAAVGGMVGGMIGGAFDGGGSAKMVDPTIDDYYYDIGSTEGSGAYNEQRRIDEQRAQTLANREAVIDQANGYANTAAIYNGEAHTGLLNAQDPRLQRAAYDRMMGLADQGPGPSAAEAQLRMGQDANMAQALALARSGRGAGMQAQAMRQAQFGNAALGQQTNQQASVLRAQEAANWRAQQAQLYGQAGQLSTGMRGQDIDVATRQGQMAAEYNKNNQINRDRAYQYSQLAFNQEQQRQQILQSQLAANQNYDAQKAANYYASKGLNAGAQQAHEAATMSMIGTGISAGAQYAAAQGGGVGGGGSATSTYPSVYDTGAMSRGSDIRMKEKISMPKEKSFAKPNVRQPNYGTLDAAYRGQTGEEPNGQDEAARLFNANRFEGGPDFRQARGYSYEYKPEFQSPQNPPGEHYGPMAQDLEHVPGVVQTDPQTGMKSVNTGRLALANTAGISEQQRRLDALQAELEALRNGRASYPTPSQPGAGNVLSDANSKQQIAQLQRENAYLKGKGTLVPPPGYGERPYVAGVTVQPGYMAPGKGTRVPPPSYVNHVDLPEQRVTGSATPDAATQRQLEALRYARGAQ